jgi:hypothetical protein
MKKSSFEYLDVDSVDEELKCSICVRPLHSPVYAPQCGHTFCQQCIRRWLKKSSFCPTCRHRVHIKNYTPITTRVVLNQLSRLRMKCKLCEQMNIEDRDRHIEMCPKRIVKCTSSDLRCEWYGKREELDLHLKTCPFTQIRPILDQLIDQLETIRETQIGQQLFIQAFINNGYTLSRICTESNCHLNRPHIEGKPNVITCSLCDNQTQAGTIAVHSCLTMSCICKICFEKHSQIITPITFKRKLSSSEESNDDGNDA